MKTKDLRSMSKEDMKSKLIELRKELIKHNAQIATGTTPKSPGQVREIKKTIAKILTIVGNQTTKGSDVTHTQQEEPKATTKPSEEKKVGIQKSKNVSDSSQKEKTKAPQKKSEEK
jgi:large subunit ribosomal protein L29